jgi:hypothetical protein
MSVLEIIFNSVFAIASVIGVLSLRPWAWQKAAKYPHELKYKKKRKH